MRDWFREYDQQRRSDPRYRAKKVWVRDLWIGSGVVMLALPHPAAVTALALLTTFASFMILDETR